MNIISRIPYASKLRTTLFFLKSFGTGAEQFRVLSNYLTQKLFPGYSDEIHLKATMEWLALAQDVHNGNGVANVFSLKNGWGIAYPETSGYILATFLAYAEYSMDKSFIDRAIQIGDWEIDIQAANGGVFSSTKLRQTRVFNTGQVILGWCKLYEFTNDKKYLHAAIRAGNYLLEEQESNGTWEQDTYCGARTYHARVDWALLRLAQLSGEQKYISAALKNLHWILQQQKPNGWFANCGFDDTPPNMHVIIYTLRGLLECSKINIPEVNNLGIQTNVVRTIESLCKTLSDKNVANISGMVPTFFFENWNSPAIDSCLTGNAQFTCLLYATGHLTNNPTYKETGDIIISALKRTQLIETSFSTLKGAVPGSYPLFRGYMHNAYPNWAAKFFADALMMKINFESKLVIPA